MYNNELANFNLDNPLDDYITTITKQFKEFFGKKYAKQIDKRIANCTMIFAEKIDSVKTIKGLNMYFARLKRRCSSPRELEKLNKDYDKLIRKYYDGLENYAEFMQIKNEYMQKICDLKNDALKEGLGVQVNNPDIYDYILDRLNGVEQDPETHRDFKDFLNEIGKPECENDLEKRFGDITDRTEKLIEVVKRNLKSQSIYLSPAFKKTKKWLYQTKNTTLDAADSLFNLLFIPGYSVFALAFAPKTENNPENIKTLILFPSFFILDIGTIVHEMGHVVQTNRMTDERFKTVAGYQPKTGLIAEEIQPYDKLVSIDETFNDYIALNICKKLDVNMFDGNVNEADVTCYQSAMPFLKPFFDKYKDELIECTMGKDPDLIFKKFDKDLLLEVAHYADTIINEPDFKVLADEIYLQSRKTDAPLIDVIDRIKFDTSKYDGFVAETLENFKAAIKELDMSHDKKVQNKDFTQQSDKEI